MLPLCRHLLEACVQAELLLMGSLWAQRDTPCGVTLASDLSKFPLVTGLHFPGQIDASQIFSAGAS